MSVPPSAPAELLYHYTTAQGLLGILGKQIVWATHSAYLNDSLELRYPFSLALEEIAAWGDSADPLTAEIRAMLAAAVRSVLDGTPSALGEDFAPPSTFIFSLSAEGDDLSQWRGYCPGGGYAIGFDPELLKAAVRPLGAVLHPCRYGDPGVRDIIRQEIRRADLAFREEASGPVERRRIAEEYVPKEFIAHLGGAASLVKHGKFDAERESRLFLPVGFRRPVDLSAPDVRFRERRSTLVPYLEWPVKPEDGRSAIECVVVGPTLNQPLAIAAVNGLRHQLGLGHVRVVGSKVPYREL